MEEQPLISYQHVNVSLQGQEILSDVNLELRKGEFVYLIGKVGSGKSTLLKTIYGEVEIDAGEAWVLGNAMRTLKRKDFPTLRRKNRTEIERRIEEVLQQVGMENKGYKMPNELSGGEQQRIVIARAILNKPEIILADEPTGNLDVETGRRIVELLQDICRQGSAILMTTHNLNLLSEYPGKVYKCEHHRLTETTNS